MKNNKNELVFELLKKIPLGKVSTYKILAEKAGIKNPRTIGAIIHTNIDSQTFPCHRVVKSDGTIAQGYAFGGQKAQIDILEKEGITFKNEKINLRRFLYSY